MSYGFSAISNSDYVLIDDNYENYSYYSSGSILASNSSVSAPIIYDQSTDIVLVRSDTYNVGIYSFPGFSSGSPALYLMTDSESNITVEYIIIRKYSTVSINNNTYGLNIYKPDGNVAYSSTIKVGTIQAAVNLAPTQDGSYTTLTASIPGAPIGSKKRYFSIAEARLTGFIWDATTGYVISRLGKFVTDNFFTTYCLATGLSGFPVNANFGSYKTFLIMDV
jgi:hypothetical protein